MDSFRFVVCPKCSRGVGIYKPSMKIRRHTRMDKHRKWRLCEKSGKTMHFKKEEDWT